MNDEILTLDEEGNHALESLDQRIWYLPFTFDQEIGFLVTN